jgi:manganese/zinc/iron transport system permease protein
MMESFIPAFDFQKVFIDPWQSGGGSYLWVFVMGFFVTAACGLVGNYLILRRLALMGDAISHSILPGLAIAFLISHSRSSVVMFVGALIAGVVTTVIIEMIHKTTRVKQDAAIGVVFSTLFAIGVILISIYADKVDLDQECVLYGEIGFVGMEPGLHFLGINLGPLSVVRMGAILLLVSILILLFYKELLVSSFDSALAASLGINSTFVHYALMSMLSLTVVSAFESAGAILVVAMLILPGATASMLFRRLPWIHAFSLIHAALSSLLGIHLSLWLNCNIAGAMVVVATFLFCLAWIFSPTQGLWRFLVPTQLDTSDLSVEVLKSAKSGKVRA